MLHPALYPNIWMLHIAVDPKQWGKTQKPMKKILEKFKADYEPDRVIGWIYEDSSLVITLAVKIGFSHDGVMPMPARDIVIMGWS